MEEIKVYVVGGDIVYADWIHNHVLVDNLEDANVVLFTGGEDVDPSIYGKIKIDYTHSNIERDKAELEIFNKVRKDQLCVGICRGSQFLCAVNGGNLVQHCTGHALMHTHAITNGDKIVEITSTHHQMQYPWTIDPKYFDVLYYAASRQSHIYLGDGIRDPNYEPEIVYYHVPNKPKCLAIQGHPEYMRKEAPVIDILNKLLIQCLSDTL